MSYAKENSRTIKMANIDLVSQKEATNHVLNALLPDVSVAAGLIRNNTYSTTYASMLNPLYEAMGSSYRLPTSAPSESANWTAMGSLSFSLNLNLSLIEQINRSNADYQKGLVTWEQTVKHVERDIKKLFYSLLLQQEALKADKEALQNSETRYNQTQRAFRNGTVPQLSVLQSNVAFKNMSLEVQKEEQALSEQLMEFALLLGMPAGTKITLQGNLNTDILKVDSEKVLSSLTGYNSEQKLMEANLASLDAQMKGLNLSSFTPSLSFKYTLQPSLYGIGNSWFDTNNWTDAGNMSLTISWNLTNMLPFSTNRLNYDKLKREKEKMELSVQEKQRSIMMNAIELFDKLNSCKNSVEASQENINLAQRSYNMTVQAYNNGSVDFLEVKDAQEQLSKSQLALQQELFTYVSCIVDLEYLLDLPQGWMEE